MQWLGIHFESLQSCQRSSWDHLRIVEGMFGDALTLFEGGDRMLPAKWPGAPAEVPGEEGTGGRPQRGLIYCLIYNQLVFLILHQYV